MEAIDAIHDAIHAGNTETAKQLLAADLSLINEKDLQGKGNTPLHYAVAEHNLGFIKWLIENGADGTIENGQRETAAKWFKKLLFSVYNTELDNLKAPLMELAIQNNQSQFIADHLSGGVSCALRFSRGKTLLHWAVDYLKMDIINVLLERLDPVEVHELLHLQDSRGMTPLALVKQACQLGIRGADNIVIYLQQKLHPVEEVGKVSVFQTSWVQSCLFEQLAVEQNELQTLKNTFNCYLGSPDVVKLNLLRSTIVKLAYNTCLQAFHYCIKPIDIIIPQGKKKVKSQIFRINDLFKKLFGTWGEREQKTFTKKVLLVLRYLDDLIKQEQVDQVINFSDERSHSNGWSIPGLSKIFLNHKKHIEIATLVATLIHEVTHHATCSYDFFVASYSDNDHGFCINLKKAFQLAKNGSSGELTPDKKKLFEVRHLLERGFVHKEDKNYQAWRQAFYHWKALHSAETLTIAILALAALPMNCASLEGELAPALSIDRQFLWNCSSRPPAPERPVALGGPRGKKRDRVSASEHSEQATRPGRPGTADSGFGSSAGSSTSMDMEWNTISERASLLSLTQAVPAMQTPETAGASLALSPEALQANKPSTSFSLVSPEHQHLLKNCNQS